MAERMFGLETEYAITGIEGNKSTSREMVLDRVMRAARRRLHHLPDAQSSGMFLSNGSRLYVDCGLHPEYSTPECTNPWDAVRYLKAGEITIDSILGQLNSEGDTAAEVFCSLCNVDYVGNTTWGCHESFLHRCNPRTLPKHIIPHLVSRTIYTGGGGFDPFSAGLQFTLSPRAAHIAHATSSDSTGNRGIYHTKDEPLSASGYHRLHILCGESLCSERAVWLKVGTTALIVAMIEAGLQPGGTLELMSPVEALHAVAMDTRCREMLKLVRGNRASALQIQRQYLYLAELHLSDPFMPSWAEEVCAQWRRILDLLEEDPLRVQKILDWAMKHSLYEHHIENRGLAWEAIHSWNHVVGKLQQALNRTRRRFSFHPQFILGPNSPVLEDVALLTPYIRKRGLRWDGLERFLQLKQELLEIDTRFGQIGRSGVFHSLDRSGLLEHHVDGVDNIEHAVSNPPVSSRARIRGEVVQRFTEKRDKYRCNWQGIYDLENKTLLDLSDPFAKEEKWISDDRHEKQDNDLEMRNLMEDVDRHLRGLLRVRE
jgi:proteasome accessory factor A